MQIDRIFYPVKTLGYGNRIGIWTYGCEHHCYRCSNPELWDECPEKDVDIETITKQIKPLFSKADGITITGGEPFYQADGLFELSAAIKNLNFDGDILVYTGYTYDELLNMGYGLKTLKFIDVLIDGKYVDAMNDNVGIRGSANQRIIIINRHFSDRYSNADNGKRNNQILNLNGLLISIGIPLKTKGDDVCGS
jgi:anaerobic ribonucleoside-triphosphate reductase activating protein